MRLNIRNKFHYHNEFLIKKVSGQLVTLERKETKGNILLGILQDKTMMFYKYNETHDKSSI